MVKNYFAFGDIHGCADELDQLISTMPITKDSTLVFLGDYIDRGPKSKEVIDRILQLKEKCEVVTLKGNHEDLLMDFLEHPESVGAGLFILNGGSATLGSYGDEMGDYHIPEDHMKFFKGLKVYHETDEYFFVHAGVPEVLLKDIDRKKEAKKMIWIRDPFLKSQFKWEKIIVHGHSPVREVECFDNRINLDTGCVYNGKLTAMELPSRKIYSVGKLPHTEKVFLDDQRSRRRGIRFAGRVQVFVERSNTQLSFETLNYNEFGLLMREDLSEQASELKIGEIIHGQIEKESIQPLTFEGEIARVETVENSVLYGVKVFYLGSSTKSR